MHERIEQDARYIAEKTAHWLHNDVRKGFFRQAVSFINHEQIEGSIVEFGVGVGKSLALLTLVHEADKAYFQYGSEAFINRKIVGFDGFQGLPPFAEPHPRWKPHTFQTNYELYHPWLRWQEQFSDSDINELFSLLHLPGPQLVHGWFEDQLMAYYKTEQEKVALVHIDCDVYESARTVLFSLEPFLQSGTMLLFDDYFCYRGNPNKGEARALKEFLIQFPCWEAIPYHAYATFGKSFILHNGNEQ